MKEWLGDDYEDLMSVMRARGVEMWDVVLGRSLSADSGDVDQHEHAE